MSSTLSDENVIRRDLPNAVIYDLSQPHHVTITLPSHSTWSSGLHWHETHTEYLKVIRGSILVRLGTRSVVLSATTDDQPEVKVDRHVWHEWRRAEPDDLVIVEERTSPADHDKALFFWNLNGVIKNAPRMSRSKMIVLVPGQVRGWLLDMIVTLKLFVIFHHLDNFPVLLNAPTLAQDASIAQSSNIRATFSRVDYILTHIILYIASWMGLAFGMKPVYEEYTPNSLYSSWSNRNHQR